MKGERDLLKLPLDLPVPGDDGSGIKLLGKKIPNIELESTKGERVDLIERFAQPTVLFIYPRAGSPISPIGNPKLWDSIPGARGCTPQSCGYRDLHQEFIKLGISVFGLSTQAAEVQREFVDRNSIEYPILSDSSLSFTSAMDLPTFTFGSETLIKRMALFIETGAVKKVFYPVFPPNKNAEEVLDWLKRDWL